MKANTWTWFDVKTIGNSGVYTDSAGNTVDLSVMESVTPVSTISSDEYCALSIYGVVSFKSCTDSSIFTSSNAFYN